MDAGASTKRNRQTETTQDLGPQHRLAHTDLVTTLGARCARAQQHEQGHRLTTGEAGRPISPPSQAAASRPRERDGGKMPIQHEDHREIGSEHNERTEENEVNEESEGRNGDEDKED